MGNPETVLGVLEIVQDMTPQFRIAIRAQHVILGAFLLSTLVLFFLLNFVARRAEDSLRKNIEHSRKLETQLHQSEKLASMGRMVASIAHEIRNPLGIVRSTSEFLMRRATENDPTTKSMLTAIYDESCRLSVTVNDFLSYARPREPRREKISVRDIILKILAFMGTQLESSGVTVHANVPPDVFVNADPDLLRGAFINILINAQQSINGPGDIYIDSATAPDGQLQIMFKDSGPGFSDDALQKAKDPFFTTKDNGTGLGLPIVQSIIESHGGSLLLGNAPEGGALITLNFPSADASAQG
jgi:signal transduction histidine kinase